MATDSLLTNLKNKIAYKIHTAVTDPEAEEYAKARQQSTIEGADETGAPTDTSATVATDSKTENTSKPPIGDPNTFSITRILTNLWDNVVTAVTVGFLPMVAIILAVLIANEMIVYTPVIRAVFFVFTFIICYLFTPFLVALSCYYIGRTGYAYHINNMTDQPKVDGLPHIFAFLPLMPYTITSEKRTIRDFFLSPFYYLIPTQIDYDKDRSKLTSLMNTYYDSLKESFKYYDKVKDIKSFKDNYDKVEYQIKHLHDTIVSNSASNTAANASNTAANASNTAANASNTAANASYNVIKHMKNLKALEKEKTQFFAPQPKVEEPKVEEPKVEEPKVEEPKVEEPKVEELKVEEPKVEEPKVEEPKVEEPKQVVPLPPTI